MINKKILTGIFLITSTFCQASRPQNDELCFNPERKDLQTGEIVQPKMIVVNYTVQPTLKDSIASFKKYRVSTHYMIDKDGKIYETMHETPKIVTVIDLEYLQRRAWHAGHAYWDKISDINSYSVGILFVNEGALPKDNPNVLTNDASNTTQWFDFTLEQQCSFVVLCKQLKEIYNIDDKDIIGHGEVAINPTTKSLGRKIGPGPLFPWKQSAQQGVGLSHTLRPDQVTQPCTTTKAALKSLLSAWGYSTTADLEQAVIQAQTHHDSQQIDGNVTSCRMTHIMINLLAQHHAQKAAVQKPQQDQAS